MPRTKEDPVWENRQEGEQRRTKGDHKWDVSKMVCVKIGHFKLCLHPLCGDSLQTLGMQNKDYHRDLSHETLKYYSFIHSSKEEELS